MTAAGAATPHSQPGSAGTNPVFLALCPLLAVVAVALAAGAVTSSSPDLFGWLAAIAAAGAFLFYALSGAGRNPVRRVRLDGSAVVVEMRRVFPAAAAVFAGTLAAFFAAYAITADENSTRLVCAALCILCLIPIPDLVRASLTRGQVRFDADRIVVRSWSTEASVDWSEVADVDADLSIPSRPAMRIVTRPPAATLVRRRRRILVPLEPRTADGQVVVPAVAFDEPWLLAGRLSTFVQMDAAERAHRLNVDTVALLTGQAPFHR